MNITTVSSGFLPPFEVPRQRAGSDVTMEAVGRLLSVVIQNLENLFAFLQAHGFLLLLLSGPVNSVDCSVRESCISPFARGLCTKEKLCVFQVVQQPIRLLLPQQSLFLALFYFLRTIESLPSAASNGLDVHLFIN